MTKKIDYEAIQKTFEDTIKYFNFEECQKIMTATNWTWFDSNGKAPTKESMMNCLRELFRCALEDLEESAITSVSSGGFKIIVSRSGKVYISFGKHSNGAEG